MSEKRNNTNVATGVLGKVKSPNAIIVFDETDEMDFLNLLDHLAKADIWVDVKLKDLYLEAVPYKVSPVGLSMALNGTYVPVFEEAMYSIKRRAENTATILKALSPEDVALILNKSWPNLSKLKEKQRDDGYGKALVRDGNLIAIHSSRYVPFLQRRLNGKLAAYLEDHFQNVAFKRAVYQHHLTEVTYTIEDEKIIEGYVKVLNEANYSVSVSDIQLAVTLRTSDTGMSSVSVLPEFSIKGQNFIPFCAPINTEHKDGATIDDVVNDYQQIFAEIEKAAENMKKLLKIELTFPKSVLVQICRRFKIPVTSGKLLEPQFSWFELSHTKMTAHEFYTTLCELFYTPEFAKLTENRKLAIKNAVLKILNMTDEKEWDKLDVPGKDW